ncbi:hypothetical protein COP2_034745 [Malus domestica]
MIGILASIHRPEPFSKLVLTGASPRFLNDREYHGGFEQEEIEKMFLTMDGNYEAWIHGFMPLAVGADIPTAGIIMAGIAIILDLLRKNPSPGTVKALHSAGYFSAKVAASAATVSVAAGAPYAYKARFGYNNN